MAGGRPTDDPKSTLMAFRLAPRHTRMLQRRANRESVSLSEALRRYLDEIALREARRGKRRTKG